MMPYIKQELREALDSYIENLSCEINPLCSEDEIEGILNYIITNLLDSVMKQDFENEKWRYKYINRVIGVLECVKLEFYRRLAAPYEDKAIAKNGDIDIYKKECVRRNTYDSAGQDYWENVKPVPEIMRQSLKEFELGYYDTPEECIKDIEKRKNKQADALDLTGDRMHEEQVKYEKALKKLNCRNKIIKLEDEIKIINREIEGI